MHMGGIVPRSRTGISQDEEQMLRTEQEDFKAALKVQVKQPAPDPFLRTPLVVVAKGVCCFRGIAKCFRFCLVFGTLRSETL